VRFLMMVKADKECDPGTPESDAKWARVATYNEALEKAGALMAMEGLESSTKGARVKYAHGKVTVTDGPFAETKELVAGFWLIQAPSMAECVAWAKRVPFEDGEVEIRPLFELTDFPVDPAEKPDGWRDREEQMRAAPPPRTPGTIRFMGLLKGDVQTEAGALPDEKLLADMGAFFEEGVKSGVILSGEGLQPTSKGVRVKYAGSRRTVVDGPFTESKELIAGYAIIQAKSWDAAIEWTKRFVTVDAPGRYRRESDCELRQILD
jgi:hypothetical protein